MDFIAAGHEDESIEETGFLEVRSIVQRFNEILGRMQTLEDSRQEFVSNVSHELKTPMTSMKVLADSLFSREIRFQLNYIENSCRISLLRSIVRT